MENAVSVETSKLVFGWKTCLVCSIEKVESDCSKYKLFNAMLKVIAGTDLYMHTQHLKKKSFLVIFAQSISNRIIGVCSNTWRYCVMWAKSTKVNKSE